jgi:hypothetical protein
MALSTMKPRIPSSVIAQTTARSANGAVGDRSRRARAAGRSGRRTYHRVLHGAAGRL